MCGEELTCVYNAFESNYIAPLGPHVDAFEREFSIYVGIKHCLALSSGTAAMHLALRLLGIEPGDEVIASTLTFIGSVSPIIFQGASPVFIDADRSSWNMDSNLLANELESCASKGKLPKAVIPTDLYGQCADYDQIQKICDSYNIPIIIDAAESLGAKYKTSDAGAAGFASIFSFNGNKIITTSGGGMLASNDKKLIDHARKLSQQAREPLPHYEHTEIGYNYRMSNILAAIGRGQLKVLRERVKRKREVFNYYEKALGDIPGIEFMPEATYGRSNRWLTVILINSDIFGANRETVRLALEAENIESRPVWKPMHMQPLFSSCTVVGGNVAERLFKTGLCLPSGTAMLDNDI
ncbi:MAG: aminotransferase class I/II-fold pyridoxal phosphate-dependent enzyme, partial [Thermodesulfobacteriota bacterium]|nr:aminotransferase class I/II-fold pyridoxal phosphate-dependent enzyme [Thermodesulfobacteriota bacterium]